MANKKLKFIEFIPPPPPAWCDLSHDILWSIMERLSFVDQIRFRAVCRSWRRMYGVKPNDKLPWVLLPESWVPHDGDMKKYFLYNPNTMKVHWLENKARNKGNGQLILKHEDCILAEKCGWLLIQRKWDGKPHIFLFNAFTQQVIDVPTKGLPFNHINVAKIAYGPERRRFAVYSVWIKKGQDNAILISTWRSGDEEWQIKEFRVGNGITMNDNGVRVAAILRAGCIKRKYLYCGLLFKGVAHQDKSWSLLVVDTENMDSNEFEMPIPYRSAKTSWIPIVEVVEYEENILVRGYRNWSTFRLDLSKREWVSYPFKSSRRERVLFSFATGLLFNNLTVMLSAEDVLALPGSGQECACLMGPSPGGYLKYQDHQASLDGSNKDNDHTKIFQLPRGLFTAMPDECATWVEPLIT